MKTIGNLTFLLFFVTALLPDRLVAQDKVEDMAKRIEQLEKENAQLRAELKALQQAPPRYEIPREPLRSVPTRPLRQQPQNIPEMTREQRELLEEVNRLRGGAPPAPVYELPGLTPEQREMLAQANASRTEKTVPPEHRQLYLEELALAQKYYDYIAREFEGGRSTQNELSRARQQLFALKREVARVDANQAKQKEAVQEELDLVTRLLKDAKKRITIGTAAPGSELDLEREVLKLKRELLGLE